MAAEYRGRPVPPIVRRALPRVGGVAVGIGLMASGGSWWSQLGVFVLVLSLAVDPVRWWRYVVTGLRREPALEASYSEAGDCSVELSAVGDRPIQVIKALREVTAADLMTAKAAVDSPPAVIATGLSAVSAARVREQVEGAGATATVVRST